MNTDDSDRGALTEVVATLERAQRHEQVEEFVARFHPDAVWVTGGGRRLIGRDAIAEFTGQVLPGAMAHSTARLRRRAHRVRPPGRQWSPSACRPSTSTASRWRTGARADRPM
jgi:uncharacterized protein (TIGR02246 family)